LADKRVEYVLRVGPSDRYRHLHIKERGRIVFFRVQYETKIRDRWFPVVRYDTTHGYAHRDMLNIRGEGMWRKPLYLIKTIMMF
jgi:hypothetical protein